MPFFSYHAESVVIDLLLNYLCMVVSQHALIVHSQGSLRSHFNLPPTLFVHIYKWHFTNGIDMLRCLAPS